LPRHQKIIRPAHTPSSMTSATKSTQSGHERVRIAALPPVSRI
jgi:hypothetical protein